MNVLLDLDGTLTDPRRGIFACIRYALDGMTCESPSDAALARFIGPPLSQSFATMLGTNDDAQIRTAIALYRERFSVSGLFENEVYAGIPEALGALRNAGASLYLATAKPLVYAERILEHFDLRQHFSAIHGSELDGTRTDKGELIAYILDAESLSPESTYMVGDRMHDVVGAMANEVCPIGVLWGYGSREELLDAGATALCDSPASLEALLVSGAR